MTKAVGVDIIEVERIARSVNRFGNRFLQRVYTARELAYCNGQAGSLAARWAAKEAVAKAFGTGIGDVSFLEIEVVSNSRRCPAIELHGAAARLAARQGWATIAVSLSHTAAYAVAVVIAE